MGLPTSALAATLSLDPVNGTFNRGCNFSLNVNLDTQGGQTDGTDAILIYDPSRMTAQSITNGIIYPDYPGNTIDNSTGKVSILSLASVDKFFSGKGTLATVNFTVQSTAPTGVTQVSFDFDPNNKAKTTDSNVVERATILDLLSSVVNGNYIIGTGSCGAQTSPAPTIGPGTSGTVVTQFPGGRQGTVVVGTPPAQPKTLDQFVDKTGEGPGTPQLTFTLAIIGSVLTVLGILGLALL
ncbi:hypothetical protein A2964_00240 [Candidatus Daviesbacteria bacterium RIFCSPLOWO2_01_FULL_40_27]|nr:MAG: hypothetical protein A2964_00240 [Candidatus Daviesbacteria bacterium RIFCSPLOWO2_01_FULL_40_27]